MSQPSLNDEVLAYLHQIDPVTKKRRGISQLEALGMFRAYRLGRCIHDLRNRGVKIRTEMRSDPKGKRYARYFLIP